MIRNPLQAPQSAKAVWQTAGRAYTLTPLVNTQRALTAAQMLANPLKLKNSNKMPKHAIPAPRPVR